MTIRTAVRKTGLAFAVAAVLSAVLYIHYPALSIGYMADDFDLLGSVQRNGAPLLGRFPAGRPAYFRPAPLFTYYLEEQAGGGPRLHHAVNLAVHLLNGLLLYLALRAAGAGAGPGAVLALFFLVHRASVPNVYWISARAELLCTSGILSCALVFLRAGHAPFRAGQAILFGVGLMTALASKESAIMIPVILWLLGQTSPGLGAQETGARSIRKSLLLTSLTAAIATAGLLIWRFHITGLHSAPPSVAELFSGSARGAAQLLFPVSEWTLRSIAAGPLIMFLSAAAAALLLTAAWRARRKRTSMAILAALPLAPFIPPLATQGGGDARLLYCSAAMLCIAAVVCAGQFQWSPITIGGISALMAALMFVGSIGLRAEWLRNYRIAEQCCRDFRRLTGEAQEPVVLITAPSQFGEAPVLANDAGAALRFCVSGEFGYQENVQTLAEIVSPSPVAPHPVAGTGSGIARQLPAGRGWMEIPAVQGHRLYPGSAYSLPFGNLQVLSAFNKPGRVSAFIFVPARPTACLLEFDGRGFRSAVFSGTTDAARRAAR